MSAECAKGRKTRDHMHDATLARADNTGIRELESLNTSIQILK